MVDVVHVQEVLMFLQKLHSVLLDLPAAVLVAAADSIPVVAILAVVELAGTGNAAGLNNIVNLRIALPAACSFGFAKTNVHVNLRIALGSDTEFCFAKLRA